MKIVYEIVRDDNKEYFVIKNLIPAERAEILGQDTEITLLVSFVVKRTLLVSEARDERLRGLSTLSAGGILDSSCQACFA